MKSKFLILLKIAIAILLLQSLFYKFSAHPDSVYIFTKIGMEPFGRIGIGVLELVASILLFIPRTTWAGILLIVGVISGAIFFHLTKLGIAVYTETGSDEGKLFYTAIAILVLTIITALFERKRLLKQLKGSH